MAMEIDEEEIIKAMRYWKTLGVVKEEIKDDDDDIYYEVVEKLEDDHIEKSNQFMDMVISFLFLSLSIFLF